LPQTVEIKSNSRFLSALGDPLIKGLTEVANLRPTDPIAFLANYLHNFSNDKPKTTAIKASEIEKPAENQLKSKLEKPSAIPVKQKSIENLLDDDDADATPGSDERDEHGQSMLHFAAARQHGKNALFTLIEEAHVSVTYRDEIYRTARDVSLQASQPDNCKEIDRYVLSLAARGELGGQQMLQLLS
jgi:Dpy-30 motif